MAANPILIQSSSPLLPSPSTLLPPRAPAAAVLPPARSGTSVSPRVPLAELLGNFTYAAQDAFPSRTLTGEATTKRRRIELADAATISIHSKKPLKAASTTEMPAPKPAKKPKQPKKKAQTITALATAAYQPVREPDSAQDTVSEYFTPRKAAAPAQTTVKANPAPEETAKVKKPRKPRTKKAPEDGITTTSTTVKKPRQPKKTKVKFSEADHRPPLYSPGRANAQAQQQQFLFGTSSQLAVDESPTFIQEMQLAIHESEMVPGSQAAAASPAKKSSTKVPTAPHGTCLSVEQANKELWCSAARDFKGGIMRDDSGLQRRKPPMPKTVQHLRKPDVEPILPKMASIVTSTTTETEKSAPHDERTTLKIDSPIKATTTRPEKSAHDDSWTVLKSDSPVTAISPPKRFALHPKDVNSPLRARRTKKSVASKPDVWQTIDEISDSDTPPTPSPPRRRASASPTPVIPLDLEKAGSKLQALSTNAVLKCDDPQWLETVRPLYAKITTTVKSCPRTTDAQHPSWYEKILLYDPIVLEDFTAWLNAQGLRVEVTRVKRKAKGRKKRKKDEDAADAAPIDGSVAAKGRKKRKKGVDVIEAAPDESDAGEVEVVQEELQAWMVQKWCEEKSVCCLWKEGMRGGVRTRY